MTLPEPSSFPLSASYAQMVRPRHRYLRLFVFFYSVTLDPPEKKKKKAITYLSSVLPVSHQKS